MKSESRIRLGLLGLPQINSMDELSSLTHLSTGFLSRIVADPDRHYLCYKINKKGGGKRTIAQPSSRLKALQGWILRNILDGLSESPASRGFCKRATTRENALPHIGARNVLCIDIENFFPSIRGNRVYSVFHLIGYSPMIASLLSTMCTWRNRLPQGAPTSPKLANLVCYRLDARILGYVGKRGIVYTRYADDMTFSSRSYGTLLQALPFVRRIINAEGFQLNDAKTRIAGPARRKRITGLVVTDEGVGVGRIEYRRLRAVAYQLAQARKSATAMRRVGSLEGHLGYLKSVDPPRLELLLRHIEKLKAKNATSALSQLSFSSGESLLRSSDP